jgi:hypothetical protein
MSGSWDKARKLHSGKEAFASVCGFPPPIAANFSQWLMLATLPAARLQRGSPTAEPFLANHNH